MAETPEPISKISIIVSKGSLEGIYPALIMANGARAEGIEANLFFTFFGLDAVHKKRIEHIKVATVGNPGMHLPTLVVHDRQDRMAPVAVGEAVAAQVGHGQLLRTEGLGHRRVLSDASVLGAVTQHLQPGLSR